ncbi:MAG TPA: FG-GAP-like repeat-containing protein, partial [bacterium]|nr:FG-GAP-like repeat-containing protein [bacterium]
PYIDLAAGANSESVSAADIDGDNKPDIIFTNRNDNTLSIYRNQSTPDTLTASSFSGLVNFTAATGPGKIAVADFDGDLKTDIATVNPGSATFSVFRNTATPGLINTSSLADRVDFMPGAYQISLAAGDMNSDLKPDIISVAATLSKNNTSAGSITSGSFSTAFTFNVGTQPNDVELADLDGDGLLDVSMLDYVDKKLYIYRNAMAIVPRMADSLALVDLYDSLNGNGWTNKTNWKSGNPIDTWFGITVTDGRVSHVELGNNNLSGFIPSSVGNISAIKNLNLFNNNVGGPIPATISALTEIVSLNLQNNQLTGSIPASITALTKLKHLYLDFNTLSGAIPSDIDNLTDLETLSLYQNQLSGTIPGGIWNLHKLNHLALGPNPGLSGTLPAQIENLDSLQSLFISSCGLTGSIPPEIGNLNKILMIYASDNQFTGTIPASIGNLSLLRTLHLANNNLSGSLPSSLANLHRLESLDIKENKFTDLGDLNPVDSLNVLMIEQNQFTFEDIEPNITAPRQSFTYAPQDSIGTYKDTAVTENAATSLAVSVGGSGNQYLWFKDGSSTGITTPVISFGSFAFANAGTYHCQITNTVATALTLYSRTYTVKLRGPSIPTGLTASAQSASQINLSWSASQNNPIRYRIYRSPTSGSGFVQVDSVSHPTVAYNNTGLTADTDYYYRITAVDAAGLYSAATTQASARTLQTAVSITSVSLLVGPTQPNENTIVTISVPVSGSAPVVKLYYAKNSSVNPDSTEMTLSSGPYVASIPASFVTAQGLWFRIRAYNNTGSEFYPSSTAKHPINVKAGASTLSAIRSSGAYPSGMIADGYSTFGLPMDTSVGIPALFGSQIFNSKNEPTNWRIQKYADGSFTDETSAFTSGTGYFVYHRLGSSVQVDIPPGSLTHAAGTFENFVLKPGWNLVPWPYTFSANFTITDESAIDPIQTQIGGNWQIVSSFKPFGAYAIKNTTASDILAGDVIQWTLSTSKVTVDYDLISDSFVRLSAVSGRYLDNDNFAGFSDAARDGDDPLDNEEPPAIGPGVNLYFTNGTEQRQYADIRSRGDGHVWDFHVNDRNNGKRINLAWDLAHIPDRMSAVLINIAENKWINLGEQTSYAFSPVKENRFKLIIGTSDFVQQTSIALAKELPSSFALHQNHPNPFNPSTTIRYDIAHAGHVRIKIYNLLGQEIVTLVDQFVNTGRYSKLWDGRDRLGNKVASGIYIYRLETSKFVRSKKMLLMK